MGLRLARVVWLIVRRTGEQELASRGVEVGCLLHGKQKTPTRPLELVDGSRTWQRLDEADRIGTRPPEQAFVVEAVPGVVRQLEQLTDEGGLASLPRAAEDDETERREQLADLLHSVPVQHYQGTLVDKTPQS